jgi:predicted RNA-binding Zn ribbon-like protein
MDSRPPAIFIGDAPGLDFLNSIATPVDTPVDWIADGDGLLRWLREAGLAPTSILAGMRTRAHPGELDEVAGKARDLREWFRAFVRGHMGRPLTAKALAELEPLNRLLERDESFNRIVLRPGEALQLQSERRWADPSSLLLPVAEAMAQLVCTEDFFNVKACEGPNCTLLFADHTRGHARRWCSMAICGNRAKQAAHRHRRKTQH